MTIGNFADRILQIMDELTILKSNASESYDKFINAQTGNPDTTVKAMTKDFQDKASMYDRLFEEKESHNEQHGVKKRMQTLQEYVLLLFFISYAILAVAMTLYMTNLYGFSSAIQGFIMMALLILPIIGLMVIYA